MQRNAHNAGPLRRLRDNRYKLDCRFAKLRLLRVQQARNQGGFGWFVRTPPPRGHQVRFMIWKRHWQRISPADGPTTVSAAVKLCSKTEFPNVHVLLRIACTIPVTSCECKRTASSLRRLQTFTPASMAQDRLSSLALIRIPLSHGNWPGRSSYDLFCPRTTQNATHIAYILRD